ncbi:MAG: hypothetical protein IIT48_10985 [Lachnospiraceae bacterium]|nr:hypothetical protein [Lachnospiraceae bacterium]
MNIQGLNQYKNKWSVADLSMDAILYRRELEQLNSLFPGELKELKTLVSRECDKLDYPGSMIYDECPDNVMFTKKCNDICCLAKCNCKYGKKCTEECYLKDIIKVLMADEIYKRRQKRYKGFR